jgi:hypothetical protein
MTYKTKEEAQRIADIENMGRDYGTAVVISVGNLFTIKII